MISVKEFENLQSVVYFYKDDIIPLESKFKNFDIEYSINKPIVKNRDEYLVFKINKSNINDQFFKDVHNMDYEFCISHLLACYKLPFPYLNISYLYHNYLYKNNNKVDHRPCAYVLLHLFAFPMPKMYLHCHSKHLLLSAFQMKNGVNRIVLDILFCIP